MASPEGIEVESLENSQERIRILEGELEDLRNTLEAIQSGEVDAVMVSGPQGPKAYTLENADRPYRLLIEQIQEGAVTLTRDGLVLYCNNALAGMLRTPAEKIVGNFLASFIVPGDVPILRELLARGGKREVQFATGKREPLQAYLSLNELPEGDGRMMCGVITDISLQKRQQKELNDENQQLKREIIERARTEESLRQAQKMEAVGQLTGGLAHDFNNLLTVILGNLQLVSVRLENDEKLLKYINNAIGATERGASLTQKLLAFSRRQSLKSEIVQANNLLTGLQMLARQVVGINVDFQVTPNPDLWHCRTDANQLESALLNMIINARDAMPNGGQLSLKTANVLIDEAAATAIVDAIPGKYVMLALTDTGTGISSDALPHVFEPFFTTKGVGKGSGLGLSMVYGFVRQMNGFVTVDSEEGRGTTIGLYLPFAEVPAFVEGEGRARSPSMAQSGTVLIVEDDPEVLEITRELVSGLGYSILTATHASEALAILATRQGIDLVFSDVVMPGEMNGLDLARWLSQHYSGLPVLLTSGYISPTLEETRQLEVEFPLLRKPYDRAELALQFEQLLRGSQSDVH